MRKTRALLPFYRDSLNNTLPSAASVSGSPASLLRALQTGRIRWYLSYLILTLLGLLLYLGLARAR